ncbi:hypothetical protein FB45DRAFT_1005564 [Roridomyces roridus]|uniref:Uncharacterized protein n=1 Tax=Roridomyces roridus TaxID=1738132 RepID=A0AAD7BM87_9AGAR|nr:hypothetical protein FB45DRAFT_1005564 [Roridomyces roridus]
MSASPITFQYDGADELDLGCPHSPTSSLRAVFVRSRPTSMAVSDVDPTEFINFPTELSAYGMAPVSVPRIDPAPPVKLRKKKPSADTASVRTMLTTRTAPIRAVRRPVVVVDDDDDDVENVPPTRQDKPLPRRRGTWDGIRGRVSGIFTRKPSSVKQGVSAPAPSPIDDKSTPAPMIIPTPRHTASKFSLRSHANTVGKAAPVSYTVTKAETPAQRKKRVRRSRSFSGFTNMGRGDESDDDLDEATLEATRSAAGFGCLWRYEEEEEDQTGEGVGGDEFEATGLLERGVEF